MQRRCETTKNDIRQIFCTSGDLKKRRMIFVKNCTFWNATEIRKKRRMIFVQKNCTCWNAKVRSALLPQWGSGLLFYSLTESDGRTPRKVKFQIILAAVSNEGQQSTKFGELVLFTAVADSGGYHYLGSRLYTGDILWGDAYSPSHLVLVLVLGSRF